MIKYKYAINQNGSLVDINDLSREMTRNDTFTCLACGHDLNPRFGSQRVHHFYHKVLPDEIYCNGQTYLHLTSIEFLHNFIKDRINNKKSLLVHTPTEVFCKNCHFPHYHMKSNCFLEYSKFDLLSRYSIVNKEQPDGKFQPDILLKNNDEDKIYIEITVTHGVDEEKISSGIKIIEIFINDESQIKILNSENAFISKSIKIKFHNFNKPEYKTIEPEECKQQIAAFVLYTSGKPILNNFYIKNLNKIKNSIFNVKFFDDETREFLFGTFNGNENTNEISKRYILEIEEAFKNKLPIKSCHLCAYHIYNENSLDLNHKFICIKNNNSFKEPNDASTCNFYIISSNSFYSVQYKKFKEKQKNELEIILQEREKKRKKEEERLELYFEKQMKINKIKNDEENKHRLKIISETVVKFIIHYDGSAVFISEHKNENKYNTNCKDIIYSIQTDIPILYYKESIVGSWRHSAEYITEIKKAYNNGIPIKNCYLCQNHKLDHDNEIQKIKLICSLNFQNLKEPNIANSCEQYKPSK